MLNRFQFGRLRAFRRGNKRTTGTTENVRKGNGAPSRAAGSSAVKDAGAATRKRDEPNGEIHDRWEDDDRVARLLERRQAMQRKEREDALARLGRSSGPEPRRTGPPSAKVPPATPTEVESRTTRVDFTPAAPPDRRADARTRTVPARVPAAPARPVSTPLVSAPTEAPAPAEAPAPTPVPAFDDSEQRVRLVEDASALSTASVVCIASGKGGTGKSVLATNIAILRAKRGERVLLVDFDAGLANAHLLLGLAPPYDVGHVMEGEVSAQAALVEGPHGLKLLSGGVGRQTMIDPTRRELDKLFKALRPLEDEFDLILIDHGAGLSYSTVAHLAATSTLILVTNHEVTALSDGYALYKRARMVNQSIRVGMVVNRVPDERIAMDAWERFRGASHKFLGHTPELIGWVPADPAIPQAVQMRKPAVLSYPDSPAAIAIQRVADWAPIDHARTATAFYEKARRALR